MYIIYNTSLYCFADCFELVPENFTPLKMRFVLLILFYKNTVVLILHNISRFLRELLLDIITIMICKTRITVDTIDMCVCCYNTAAFLKVDEIDQYFSELVAELISLVDNS